MTPSRYRFHVPVQLSLLAVCVVWPACSSNAGQDSSKEGHDSAVGASGGDADLRGKLVLDEEGDGLCAAVFDAVGVSMVCQDCDYSLDDVARGDDPFVSSVSWAFRMSFEFSPADSFGDRSCEETSLWVDVYEGFGSPEGFVAEYLSPPYTHMAAWAWSESVEPQYLHTGLYESDGYLDFYPMMSIEFAGDGFSFEPHSDYLHWMSGRGYIYK